MPRNYNLPLLGAGAARRGTRFWLQVTAGVLAVANAVALALLIAPPGGSGKELRREREQLRAQIASTRASAVRVRNVANKVQLGSKESGDFELKFFLPKRDAYDAVIEEIQRMAQSSGIQERDAVYTEEPIEGSADLTVLNITANYEGAYDSLIHFLYEADRSPMLLMLDTLTAAPQQKGGQINTSIRFQAVIKEEPSGRVGGQP
jgi:Tfp pilus assembly protein PilO